MAGSDLALISARASKVLGEYEHEITFDADDDFLIIYGPNGVGKTKLLEIIHATLRLDGVSLSRLPFETASMRFQDGSVLEVISTEPHESRRPGRKPRKQVEFVLVAAGRDEERWVYTGSDFASWLLENTSWSPVEDEDLWRDRRDGEIAHIADLEHRFSDRPQRNAEMPTPFRAFRRLMASYLIETQRLRIEQARGPRPAFLSSRETSSSTKIGQHAEKMRTLVNQAQTLHSRITQQLDRDFPSRVLAGSTAVLDANLIRRRYEEQNAFRSRVGQVASVDLVDALSLPDRDLDDWELRLLTLYLDDAERKLEPFGELLQKIELLEEIVNSRLLRKTLQVTEKDGLAVRHAVDGRPIDLDALSSGEQHEIILLFDLLFSVPRGALVMIDEPEISLHVTWQLAFIPDVQRIAELSGFRFIVATHSPQIINDAWDKAHALGPAEIPFA